MEGDLRYRVSVHRNDDALGCWTVASCEPCPMLQPYVATLWFGEGQVSYKRDRILPTTDSYLLINLGLPQYLIETGPPQRNIPFKDVWYSGLQQRPIETEAPHGSCLLGVAFRSAGARPWLHVDADQTADRVLGLAELLGDGVHALRQALLDCRTIERRFALVEDWLLSRLQARFEAHALVPWALQRIADSAGQLAIDDLAREAGVSRKYLGLLFRRDVGLAPKSVARIHRFKSAVTLLAGCDRVPWVELAAHCGYYDQSHLIRDFHGFSGFAPGEFVRQARPDGGSVVVE